MQAHLLRIIWNRRSPAAMMGMSLNSILTLLEMVGYLYDYSMMVTIAQQMQGSHTHLPPAVS